MFTDTYDAALVDAVERMGYGVEINNLRGYVIVNTGSGRRKDDHRFKSAALALAWVEQRERAVRNFGR